MSRSAPVQAGSTMCVGGCGTEESASHIFLQCHFFGRVWYFIWNWLGLLLVAPANLADQFLQFSQMGGI